jgi:hypothetical protein
MSWEGGKYTIKEIGDFISRACKHLSNREEVFAKSIMQQLEAGSSLSWSQELWMGKIMEKYSPERIEEEKQWAKNFCDKLRKQAIQVAKYYEANPPYFGDIASRVLAEPKSFTLSKAEWARFCENKYAMKIRNVYKEELKYKKADCIQIRANNRIDIANHSGAKGYARPNRQARRREANKVGFILEADAKPVTRAAKGSRVYKILLSGETSPIFAHESDIKRKR